MSKFKLSENMIDFTTIQTPKAPQNMEALINSNENLLKQNAHLKRMLAYATWTGVFIFLMYLTKKNEMAKLLLKTKLSNSSSKTY